MRCFLCVCFPSPLPPFLFIVLEVGLAATCDCGTINPYVTIGFCHPYQMDESTFIFGTDSKLRMSSAQCDQCVLFDIYIMTKARVFFYLSFYRPSRPIFLEIEKKIKEIFFFDFIFLFPSDSCQYSTGVQLCFFVLSFLLLPG